MSKHQSCSNCNRDFVGPDLNINENLCPDCEKIIHGDCLEQIEQLQNKNNILKGLLGYAKCPNCDGSGGIQHQISSRTYVSKDMATDAGDPALEGSLYTDDEWEAEQCQWCDGREQALRNE